MATTPSENSIATPTQTTPITVTRAALVQNVTWNKEFRATIKAYKAILKGPDAHKVPWIRVINAERETLLKLRWYYTIADAAYQNDRVDPLDVPIFWDLYDEHYYAAKRWTKLRDRYNRKWNGNGDSNIDASTTNAAVEDSDSSTDNDSDTDDANEARPRQRRGVARRGRPLTSIEE